MRVADSVKKLRKQIRKWRKKGKTIAFVPTMGNLHEGHLSLVNIGLQRADRVVVSIFVNPTQFAEGEDFSGYPRTLEQDSEKLEALKTHLLYVPDVDDMYPHGIEEATQVSVPALTSHLCGKYRPGHFDGVTTVVLRLFNQVQPDIAVFGQKDFQQQLVVRRMTEDLSLPIEIINGPTRRAANGLALSSRNNYLSQEESELAPELFNTLTEVVKQLQSGATEVTEIEASAMMRLKSAGFDPEYVKVRSANTLEPVTSVQKEQSLVVLASAWLGKARLIDNLVFQI